SNLSHLQYCKNYGDREPAGIHQTFLQRPLPGATPIAIAATAIGQNEQMRVRPVPGLSLTAPPVTNRGDGELRGVMGDTDIDGTAIGLRIIDAVGLVHQPLTALAR